jgi:hypothetical protein
LIPGQKTNYALLYRNELTDPQFPRRQVSAPHPPAAHLFVPGMAATDEEMKTKK